MHVQFFSRPLRRIGITAISVIISCIANTYSISSEITIATKSHFFEPISKDQQATFVIAVYKGDKNNLLKRKQIGVNVFEIPLPLAEHDLYSRYIISLDSEKPPSGYHVNPLIIDLPFYVKQPRNMILVGVNTLPGDRDEIITLARQNADNPPTSEELFEIYARASRQIEWALASERKDDFTRDQVRAVFSFLQAARRLTLDNFLLVGDQEIHALNYLSSAIENAESIVANAIPLRNAKQLRDEYLALPRMQKEKMYEAILGVRSEISWTRGCQQLRSFYKHLQNLHQSDFERVNERKLSARVANGVAQCLYSAAKNLNYLGKTYNMQEAESDVDFCSAIDQHRSDLLREKDVARGWTSTESNIQQHLDALSLVGC